jgi:hypothetical protein
MKNIHNAKAALIWITEILKNLNIPFQIAGGLAAIAYGSARALHDIDIDIPEDKFGILENEVKKFITYGPACFKDEKWNLTLMTLNYNGQLIDLSGAYQAEIFDEKAREWRSLITDFSRVEIKTVLGLQLPVIPFDVLLAYKKILAREVDLMDITELTREINFRPK